jgi:hypothetical protein
MDASLSLFFDIPSASARKEERDAATRLHTADIPFQSESMLAWWVVGIDPSMRAR